MSLVDQIFEQARLGTAPDPGANPFLSGVQVGQHQQQLNMELAQLPLRQTLLQQDAALKAAQTEQLLSARQDEIATQQQLGGLSGQVAKAWTEATPQDAIPLMLDALKTTPGLANNPNYQQLWKNTQTAIAADNLSKHYDAMAEARKASTDERRFKDMPAAAKFTELARQAENSGDSETAQLYRDHADLEIQKEARLQQQQRDIHERNQIRLKQFELSVTRTEGKGALAKLQSDLRDIENAPRLTLEDRKKASDALFADYEKKYGQGAPAIPPITAPPATNGFKIKVIKP